MPLWINAANAVLVTSDYEGFGLVCRRGAGLRRAGALDPGRHRPLRAGRHRGLPLRPTSTPRAWSAAARPHLEAPDPRVAGAARAASLSAARMAERAIEAYRDVAGTR